MTDQTPEIVASADLSPVSPSPLHNTYTLPQVLPDLQHQAENPDVVPGAPTTYRTAEAAMAPEADPTDVSDTIVVAGVTDSEEDESMSEADADADSVDLYGEEETGQEQNNEPEAVDNDDYLKTFDSPAREQDEVEETQTQQQQQQEDVTEAPESMIISETSDTMPDQSPVASTSADITTPSLSTDALVLNQPTGATETARPTQPDAEPKLEPVSAAPDATQTAQVAPSPDNSAGSSPISMDSEVDDKPYASEPKQEDPDSKPDDVQMEDDAGAIDIQKLVDQITAKAEAETKAEASTEQPAEQKAAMPTQSDQNASQSPPFSSMSVNPASLPSKPPLALPPPPSQARDHAHLPQLGALGTDFPSYSSGPLAHSPSSINQPGQYALSGAPSTSPAAHTFPSSMPSGYNAAPSFAPYPNAQAYPGAGAHISAPGPPGFDANSVQQAYDAFLADERKHMSEAKWERFPEGSRIFIGNLSQERVSKRDVFNLFHPYGSLAQISLKSAYGFVQYHTVAHAQAAMNALQGAEVKGRKINLEISRNQKQKKDRDHSPDRKGGRDRGGRGADRVPDHGGRPGDRYDGRDQNRRRSRDDYRPGRSPPPRRDDHRGRDDFGRDRGHYDASNRKHNRSRSPGGRFGRNSQDQYRRRSPSPYDGRRSQEADRLEIPRRYGPDVPDVQILLMQDVHKDFIDWVQRAFWERGLKTNAMFLNPRFPREAVIQRQVLEGVQGVVELDMLAQDSAKIPLQVFDRSAGTNVRYDQYRDLEPSIAAELVLRTKGAVAPQPAYAPPPASYPPQAYQPAPQQQYHQPPAATPDIASLIGQIGHGQLDNSTLQTLLSSFNGQQAPQAPPSRAPVVSHPAQSMGPSAAAYASNSQIDMNALLSNLGAAAGNHQAVAAHHQPQPMPGYGMPSYPGPGSPMPPAGHAPPAAAGQDPAAQVQNIMAQLARIRQ